MEFFTGNFVFARSVYSRTCGRHCRRYFSRIKLIRCRSRPADVYLRVSIVYFAVRLQVYWKSVVNINKLFQTGAFFWQQRLTIWTCSPFFFRFSFFLVSVIVISFLFSFSDLFL